MKKLQIECKPSLRIPTLVALVPFKRRIDIIEGIILIDGKPLENRIRSKKKRKAYKYLIKKLGVKRYGISRFGLYKKLKRLGLNLKKLRLYALEMVKNNKKLLEILLSIRIRGSFKRRLREYLKSIGLKNRILGRLKSHQKRVYLEDVRNTLLNA